MFKICSVDWEMVAALREKTFVWLWIPSLAKKGVLRVTSLRSNTELRTRYQQFRVKTEF